MFSIVLKKLRKLQVLKLVIFLMFYMVVKRLLEDINGYLNKLINFC